MSRGKGWGRVALERTGSVPVGGWAANERSPKTTPKKHFFSCLRGEFQGSTLCLEHSEITRTLTYLAPTSYQFEAFTVSNISIVDVSATLGIAFNSFNTKSRNASTSFVSTLRI